MEEDMKLVGVSEYEADDGVTWWWVIRCGDPQKKRSGSLENRNNYYISPLQRSSPCRELQR